MTQLTRISPAMRGARPTASVLVVDDSRTGLNAMGERLSQAGYAVVLCDRGADALDLIAGCRFDLLLLDVVMPEMSGLQVLAELRASTETVDLPVMIVTAYTDPAIARQAMAIGADDVATVPIDFEMLTTRMERLLHRAARLNELKRANAALDARIADRAIELGEARDRLAAMRGDRDRLAASLEALNRHVQTLTARTSGDE